MENKAWVRIVEASIAILIITSALVILVLRPSEEQDISKEIHEMQRLVLRQISLDDDLRQEILQGKVVNTEKFIQERVPSSWGFEVKVCEIDEICSMSDQEIKEEIYADEILISATLQEYAPKKLKLFVWVEG